MQYWRNINPKIMLRWLLLMCIVVFSVSVLGAQEGAEATAEPNMAELQATLDAAILEAQTQAQNASNSAELAVEIQASAEEALDAAQNAVDMAFNLLGLFEAISFLVTVVGGAAALFGFTRFISAQQDLNEAKDKVLQQFKDAETSFEAAIEEREQRLISLREEVIRTTEEQRQTTSQALLAQALLPLGERQYRTSDYQGALNTYQRALELDPRNPVIHQRLAYVYGQSKELEKAQYHYEEAMKLEDDFVPAMAGLGFVYRRMAEKLPVGDIEHDKLFNKSEAMLLQALGLSEKLVDDDGESWWGVLGGLYKRRGQIDQAIDAYRKVTEVTPNSSYGFGNLAMLYREKGDHEHMLETYKRVERLAAAEAQADVDNYWGHADLVVARYALGKWEEAEEVLPATMSISSPDSPYMLPSLSETLRDLMPMLDEKKHPPIQRAIERIDAFIAQRQAERKQQDKETGDDEGETESDEA
jgi:tetratricopeptide (TPR) repeat protein